MITLGALAGYEKIPLGVFQALSEHWEARGITPPNRRRRHPKGMEQTLRVLGVYDGHNCNAALVEDGRLVAAVEEERFSRVKNHDGRISDLGGPRQAIAWCLGRATGPLDAVVLALEKPEDLHRAALLSWMSDIGGGSEKRLVRSIRGEPASLETVLQYPLLTQRHRTEALLTLLSSSGVDLDSVPVSHVNHHVAHAASAYFTSGVKEALVVTMDGRGDDLAGSVMIGRDGHLEPLEEINWMQSIGHLYAAATVVCGFKAMRHEGKVTGLAAHGKVNESLYRALHQYFESSEGTWTTIGLSRDVPIGPYPDSRFAQQIEIVKAHAQEVTREDIAATVQGLTEDVVVPYIGARLRSTRSRNVLLAGGLFANVLLNQRIVELGNMDYVYIHPAMSDAGLGAGAAMSHFYQHLRYDGRLLDNVFLGPSYTDSEIQRTLDDSGVGYQDLGANIDERVGQLLAEGSVVARFTGALEYGPRALGNRSILYQTTAPDVNDWLNRKLKRTEFMPFAPATLSEHADECYELSQTIERTAEFMTVTVPCTARMKLTSPAVVHIDGTARPQLVHRERNPSLHHVLFTYYNLTGIPSVLNTSFNRHEEPIVRTPEEALESFLEFDLDYLAIGPFLVRARGQT